MNPSRPSERDAERRPPRRPRNLFLILVLAAILLVFLMLFNSPPFGAKAEKPTVDEVIADVAEGKVEKIVLRDSGDRTWEAEVAIRDPAGKEGKVYKIVIPTEKRADLLLDEVKRFNAKEAAEGRPARVELDIRGPSGIWQVVLLNFLPWLLILAVIWFFFMRQLRSPGSPGGVLTFGKSRARLVEKGKPGVTFADVAGIDEAKDEVQEIIEFLKSPKKFQRLGGRIPRGVILVGAPGTGKTLLAKAIAGEAEVPFFSICGSDFVEMFVGVGASRVRDLFKQARENSPCIVFLDEVDAVGRRRGSGLGGGHDEREQTLNAILVEMDGFNSDEGIVVIAATNRPDVLDPALLRPGRFDREIVIDLPDLRGREEILKVHLRNVKADGTVDVNRLARATPGFSGAELAAMINEGALQAALKDKGAVGMAEFEEARDKIRWGRQKTRKVMTDEDRRITAYHEAGHAVVAHLLPEVEPLHKVTIIPRGMALGATMQLPERDRYHLARRAILGNLCVLYAGRAGEEMFCDDITAGAKDDIRRATEIARALVCEWGMSDRIGPVNYSDSEEHLFLGREITRSRNHSEAISLRIDEEVRRIIDECYARTRALLEENRDGVRRVAEELLAREVLTGEEVGDLIQDVTARRASG
ncbi:MAG: ATP-dependent zinc metalloprotease FtsH [Planctomycetes bacterium]|nr:ATP-dependent zinc metalloprotease FtsH [Planctomycetota bacterium]